MRLGEAYEKQGTSDKAAAAFEQALKLNPRLASATTKLARLYAGPLQNKEKALTYAKRRASSRLVIYRLQVFSERLPTKTTISPGLTAFCRRRRASARKIRRSSMVWLGPLIPWER